MKKLFVSIILSILILGIVIYVFFVFHGYPWDKQIAIDRALSALASRNYEQFQLVDVQYNYDDRTYTIEGKGEITGENEIIIITMDTIKNHREFMEKFKPRDMSN